MENKDVTADGLLFQMHLRGIQLTEKQEEDMSKLKTKGKGKTPTKKDYLLNYVERLIQTGKWAGEINDQLLQKRMEDWRQMKGKGKGSGSASSKGVGNNKRYCRKWSKSRCRNISKSRSNGISKSFLPV